MTEISDVLIVFRGPSIVWGARGSARPAHDRSDDAIRMTKQLRKYALYSSCPRTVLMDERCAFFFFLTEAYEDEEIRYITALAPAANTANPVEQATSAMVDPPPIRRQLSTLRLPRLNRPKNGRSDVSWYSQPGMHKGDSSTHILLSVLSLN